MPLNSLGQVSVTAPTGAELAAISRSILTKKSTLEIAGKVAASVTVNCPWHDSQADGTMYVTISTLGVGTSTITLQETEDPDNVNMFRTVGTSAVTTVLTRTGGVIRARYWRVVYVNGATAQTAVQVFSTGYNFAPSLADTTSSTSTQPVTSFIGSPTVATSPADNIANANIGSVFPGTNAGAWLQSLFLVYGGGFAGTPDANRQGWSKPRTPTVFRQVATQASGNTAVWTPASGNKFRLLKFKIQVTGDANFAAAAQLTIGFQDNVTDLAVSHIVNIPATVGLVATSVNDGYDSGWIDLGAFGILSSAVNQVLNVNLSATVLTGKVNVIVAGCEE